MNNIEIKARAKVNFTLDVLSKRTDGYHNLEMIMQSLELCDDIVLTKTCDKISVASDTDIIPLDQSNLAYKAADLVRRIKGIKQGVHIFIRKNIPVCAGMAGGSADAAAVIKGVNKLWNLNMDIDEMLSIGARIGADVPFCLKGGTALARGIGDELVNIHFPCKIWIVLVKPDFGISTAQIYKRLNLNDISQRPDTYHMKKYLERCDVKGVGQKLYNVLETVAFDLYPELENIKQDVLESGCEGSAMTGSGPTIYGVFSSYSKACHAYNRLCGKYKNVFITHTHNSRKNN